MANQKITALVTGASAGIGAEFCRQLAHRGQRIIAVARRGDRLEQLRAQLADHAELHTVVADLTSVEGVARTMEALRQQGPVDYLVNNAGFSTFGHFSDSAISGQREMVGLHIDASITLCRAAIPFMRERGWGHIINVSSVGAFAPGRGLAVYGATKAFLNYFSLALQAELAGTGIEVQALCPGFTETEFHRDMEGFDRGRVPAGMWMQADAVVAASIAALGSGRVLVVPGEDNLALARGGYQRQLDALQGAPQPLAP
jgi:short-subunit dehydrogenase